MLSIILLYTICASMFTISKWGLAYTEPIFFVAVRMIFSGVVLGGYLLVRGRMKQSFLQEWWLFAQIIIFHIYLTYICDLCALKSLSSVESAFIYNLSPFVSALLSYVWFNEQMTGKKWFGLFLGFSSLFPELVQSNADLFANIWPRLITVVAVISSAYGWIIVRALVQKGYSPLYINGVGMFFGGLIALVTSYATESWTPSPVSQWVPFIQATIAIIVVANIVFYNLYGYLLKKYTATFLSFAGLMCPLFAGLLGRLFLGETFSWSLVLSFLIVCVGLVIFYSEELKQGYIKA